MRKKTLAIIGAGHLGQQIAHIAITDGHFQNVVFFDDFADKSFLNSYQILGNSEDILHSYQQGLFNELIIGIGYNHLTVKKRLFDRFNHHIPFANIIHSTVYIDSSVKLGTGNVIYPGCVLDYNVEIINNNLINLRCLIAHDTLIGSHNFLSPGINVAGFVRVGEEVFLGISTTIIDNISISNNIQTGGGSVVIENLINSGLYVGNPARFIRENKL